MITLDVGSGAGLTRLDLHSYLDAAAAERAQDEAYAWIKAVRHLRVDGVPFRNRFTFRGDSLWWFAELYLHKEQAILDLLRIIAAFDALVERDRPLSVRYVAAPDPRVVAPAAPAPNIPSPPRRLPPLGAWDPPCPAGSPTALPAGPPLVSP